MSEWEKQGSPWLRFLGKVWLSWIMSAAVLLPISSLIISRTPCSERAMAVICSVLSFLTACSAGRRGARDQKLNRLVCGFLCAAFIILPLLLCGLLIDRRALSPDSVLSLVSLSFAGSLFGSVFLGGPAKNAHHRRAAVRPQGRKGGLR